MSREELIIRIIGLVITLLMGSGGIFALVRCIKTINANSRKYEVRCKLAAEFLKQDIVTMKPDNAKKLFIDILEGKLEDDKTKNKVASKVIKVASESK